MKKYLLMFTALLLITACGNKTATLDKDASAEEQPEEETIKEFRDEMLLKKNKNIDVAFAMDSLFNVWDMEDFLIEEKEEINKDTLFEYMDEYIMDEEAFESLNEYEKGLAMKTSVIITKFLKGNYFEDEELFNKDLEEYYDILQNGDSLFMD
ncbi:hypothetical protein [Pseudogracilibacillus auburnensis]|uniref:hypothetical protein n=1 Tax=Pseudogracilibacillus auburnensis TaxID=1494959 RepID=UPI001A95A321|nr:hypothetical protein [Pseudogracilibacillus auburnensis]MBO1005620.1 hypothetical protein [Pseudogracilibacillus auburnensis]